MILPKKDNKKEELKVKYGVTNEIPKQPIEEDRKEDGKQHSSSSEVNSLDLLLRLEKLEGKFSEFEEIKDDFNERIARLSEEIGELRSSFLELDKNFTSLETKVEKTIDVVNELQPEKISKDLQKKESEIMKLQADIESLNNMLVSIKKSNEAVRALLEKIKNIENVISMYKKLSEKIQLIDDTKIYVDRLAGKSETIFSEMESKMKDIEDIKNKVQKLDDLTVDVVKMLDSISIKVPKFIEKENAQKIIEEEIKKDIQEISRNYSDTFKKTIEAEKNQVKKEIEEEKTKIVNAANEIFSLMSNLKNQIPKFNFEEKIDLNIKFIQLVNSLTLVSKKEEIEEILLNLTSTVDEMKRNNMWTENSKIYLAKTLDYLIYFWEYNQDQEIKNLIEQKTLSLKI